MRLHDLWHCFASWNRQAGIDIDKLADLMESNDARMTRRYTHIGPVHLASAVGELEESSRTFNESLGLRTSLYHYTAQSDEKEL